MAILSPSSTQLYEQTQTDLQLKARALPPPPGSNSRPAPVRLSVPFAGSYFYQLKREAINIGVQMSAYLLLTFNNGEYVEWILIECYRMPAIYSQSMATQIKFLNPEVSTAGCLRQWLD